MNLSQPNPSVERHRGRRKNQAETNSTDNISTRKQPLSSEPKVRKHKRSNGSKNIQWKVNKYCEIRAAEFASIASNVEDIRAQTRGLPTSTFDMFLSTETSNELPSPEQQNTFKTRLLGISDLQTWITKDELNVTGAPFTIKDLRIQGETPIVKDEAEEMDIQGSEIFGPDSSKTEIPSSIPQPEPLSVDMQSGCATDPRWFDMAGGINYFRNTIIYFDAISETARHNLDGSSGQEMTEDSDPSSVYIDWIQQKNKCSSEVHEDILHQRAPVTCEIPKGTSSNTPRPASTPFTRKSNYDTPGTSSRTDEKETVSSPWRSSNEDACEVWPAHIAYYLFEASGRERPCVCGDRCISRLCIPHPYGGKESAGPWRGKGICGTNNPNPPRLGIILKEFLMPDERQQFDRYEILPERHGPCILCIRAKCTYDSFMIGLGAKTVCHPNHRHPIDLPGGYRKEACLQPKASATHGIVLPFRRFVTNEYICTTLDTAISAGIVVLTPGEHKRLLEITKKYPKLEGKDGLPTLRGLAERENVYFFWITRWLSSQAVTQGTESSGSFVIAFQGKPPGCNSTEDENRDGIEDDIVAKSFSQRHGDWPYLITELATRIGMSIEAAKIIAGPFNCACRTVHESLLLYEKQKNMTDFPVYSELVSVIRRLAIWNKIQMPIPLSAHSIFITTLLRSEVSTDIRLSIAYDAQIIARRKATTRLEKLEKDPTSKIVIEAKDKMIPFPEETTHQTELRERVELLARIYLRSDENVIDGECQTLGDVINNRTGRMLSQRSLDRLLILQAEYESSHRPLRTALLYLQMKGFPLDDVSLLGQESLSFLRCNLGRSDPDRKTMSPWIPRRPIRISFAGGTPIIPQPPTENMGFPFPASFITPDLTSIRLKFPSHRENIRYAIESGIFSEKNLRLEEDVCIFFGYPIGSISIEKCLREFWKTADELRKLSDNQLGEILRACDSVSDVSRIIDSIGLRKCKNLQIRTFALACVIRVAIAEKLTYYTQDRILKFRLSLFAWTHADLVYELIMRNKRVLGDTAIISNTDSALIASCDSTRKISIIEINYPFDERAFSEEDMTSIAAEITGCGFFEQSSDQTTSKTMEHIIKKVIPRACEKRSTTRIMSQTADLFPPFALWLVDAIECMLRGAFSHATVRPTFATALLTAGPIIREARVEMAMRVTSINLRQFAEKRKNAQYITRESIREFEPNQLYSVMFLVTLFETMSESLYGMGFRQDARDLNTAATNIFAVVYKAITYETCHSYEIFGFAPMEIPYKDISSLLSNRTIIRIVATTKLDWIVNDDSKTTERITNNFISSGEKEFLSTLNVALNDCKDFNGDDIKVKLDYVLINAIAYAAERLARGCLSAQKGHAVYRSAQKISNDVITSFSMKISGRDPSWLDSVRQKILDGLVTSNEENRLSKILGRPLTPASVTDVCIHALGEIAAAEGYTDAMHMAVEGHIMNKSKGKSSPVIVVESYLIEGLAGAVLRALSHDSEDIRDIIHRVIQQMEESAFTSILSSLRPICETFMPGINIFEPLTWVAEHPEEIDIQSHQMGRQAIGIVLAVVDIIKQIHLSYNPQSKESQNRIRGYMLEQERVMHIRQDTTICTTKLSRHDPEWKQKEYERQLTKACSSRNLVVLARQAYAELAEYIGQIACMPSAYMRACVEKDKYRESGIRMRELEAELGKSGFIERHATICKSAVRECVVSALSRNPSLVAAFVSRASWFPEFMDNVTTTCDAIRRAMVETSEVPREELAADLADETFEETWSGKVYRLQKCDLAARIVKAATQHIEKLVQRKAVIGPKYLPGESRIKLMGYYISAMIRASGWDPRPNELRDLDVLWRFGLRTHGLEIVKKLHDAYRRFGGTTEFFVLVNGFAVDEFFIVAEYYYALTTALSVFPVAIRSLDWIESTVAAVQAKYGLADDEYTRELSHLVVCDTCEAVLTQISSSWDPTVSKVTSCNKVYSGPTGGYFCFRKRGFTRVSSLRKRARTTTKKPSIGTDEEDGSIRRLSNYHRLGWGGWDKIVYDEKENSNIIRKRPKSALEAIEERRNAWCNKPITKIYALGRVIEFRRKYKGKGEWAKEHKYPCVMTPCCGTWSRFNFDHWGPDGYRCIACSLQRGTGPILPDVCGICGKSSIISKTQRSTSTQRTDRWSRFDSSSGRADLGGVPRTQVELYDNVKRRIERAANPLITTPFKTILGIDGTHPVASNEFDYILCVVDDIHTGMTIPVGVCRQCYNIVSDQFDPYNGPAFLSILRMNIKKIQIEKETSCYTNFRRKVDKFIV